VEPNPLDATDAEEREAEVVLAVAELPFHGGATLVLPVHSGVPRLMGPPTLPRRSRMALTLNALGRTSEALELKGIEHANGLRRYRTQAVRHRAADVSGGKEVVAR